MNRLVASCCVFVLGLALSSYSFCSVKVSFITIDVEPWAYFDKERKVFSGIFPSLMKEIEIRTGYEIDYSVAPFGFSRINRELKSGRRDCTILIVQKNIIKDLLIGERLFFHQMGVVPKNNYELSGYEDLFGLKISVHKVLVNDYGILTEDEIHKDFDSSYEMGLEKIAHSRVDAVAGAISTIDFLARKNGYAENMGRPLILKSEPVRLQCSRDISDISVFENINKAIVDIKNSGRLQEIINAESLIF